MKAESIEKIIEFLNGQGITNEYKDTSGDLNRIIEFTIEGTTYYIEWWINQSYLKFKNEFSSPCIPFKHINLNTYSPTSNHKFHLCFYDVKEPFNKNNSLGYSEIPFGAIRIPFNKIP